MEENITLLSCLNASFISKVYDLALIHLNPVSYHLGIRVSVEKAVSGFEQSDLVSYLILPYTSGD